MKLMTDMTLQGYGIEPKNLLKHELIGLKTEVEESSNSNMKGLCGLVVDETRNTFVIETEQNEDKRIPKDMNTFIFVLNEGVRVRVRGNLLVSRPEDRIKKGGRRR
ncbi:MAG: ribonuclease P protein subunit [Euryarchaeota archaeon]|nr:ribonuclease P protein subunit [Euryarchaeota archaeon]